MCVCVGGGGGGGVRCRSVINQALFNIEGTGGRVEHNGTWPC